MTRQCRGKGESRLMKTLVVYYSRTGNTRKMGEEIAATLEADIEELKDDVGRSGPIGFVRSLREAESGALVHLEPLLHEPKTYDLVVVGTPVWVWTMSSPVRTFLLTKNLGTARVAWFCTLGAGSQSFKESCFQSMTNETGRTPVATLGFSMKDLKRDYSQAIADFAETLKSAVGQVQNGVV